MVTTDGSRAAKSAGTSVCITSDVLPALPIANDARDAAMGPGSNTRSVDPSSAPLTRAEQMPAAA